MLVAVMLLAVGYFAAVDAVPMGKVKVAEEQAAAAIVKAEAEAALKDADSVMPDAEIAIAADEAKAESYAPAADKDAKAEAEPPAAAAPVVEEKKEVAPEKKEVETPKETPKEAPKAKEAPKESVPEGFTEPPKQAPKEPEPEPEPKPAAAADVDAAAAAAPAHEEDEMSHEETKEHEAEMAQEREEDEAHQKEVDELIEEHEAEADGNEEGYDEGEDDDDDERLYADQEVDLEGEELTEEQIKAKGKDAGKEYQRYLAEKREQLKADPNKRAHIVKLLTEIQERDGKLEDEQKEDARSRLEEQERELVEQQRRQAKRLKQERDGLHEKANEFDFKDQDRAIWMNEDGVDHKALVGIAKRRAAQMGHLDRNRRVAFMQHEMKRLLKFKESIDSTADAKEKEELLAEHESENEELAKRRAAAPGSRKQLEKVWEEEDGLDKESFDPKTFFRLHDITGDGVLDTKELEAMFFREASKLHTIRMRKQGKDAKKRSGKDAEQDKFIVREEMARMREHVMKTADSDGDGTVSFEEWMSMTEKKDFNDEKKEWKPIVPEEEMSDKQLSNFKKLQAKLAKTKHKEVDPKLLNAAKRMRKQLTPKQKEALKKLQRVRNDAKANDRKKVRAMKEKVQKMKKAAKGKAE